MRIDEGMPATLTVGNQEIGCVIKAVIGDYRDCSDGTRLYTRVDEVSVIPWRSPYESEAEEAEALKVAVGRFTAGVGGEAAAK